MKTITLKSIIIIAVFSLSHNKMVAQVINWGNVSVQNKCLLHANAGAEYGVTTGLGYHHQIAVKRIPLWVGGEFSIPAGNMLVDDFKVRLGAQIRFIEC